MTPRTRGPSLLKEVNRKEVATNLTPKSGSTYSPDAMEEQGFSERTLRQKDGMSSYLSRRLRTATKEKDHKRRKGKRGKLKGEKS